MFENQMVISADIAREVDAQEFRTGSAVDDFRLFELVNGKFLIIRMSYIDNGGNFDNLFVDYDEYDSAEEAEKIFEEMIE